MNNTKSEGVAVPKIIEATVYTGWTENYPLKASATVCLKASGIHHTKLPQLITNAVNSHNDLLEACKVALGEMESRLDYIEPSKSEIRAMDMLVAAIKKAGAK